MSTVDAWMDQRSPIGRDREPVEVLLSRVILAFGMTASLGVVAMAVIWSTTPQSSVHAPPWRPSHQFHAAHTATLSSAVKVDPTRGADLAEGRQAARSA
jgi:hypothetical protein